MHILILGAGVIGITTAYELLKAGHEVTIIDRQPSPAMETSFKNGGLIAPGGGVLRLSRWAFAWLFDRGREGRLGLRR